MHYKKIRWVRKLLSLFILLFALVYYFTNLQVILITLSSFLLVFFSFYTLDHYRFNNKIIRLFLKLYPKKEEDKNTLFPSDIRFFISTIILLLLFPKDIAIYSLIILTFCDDAEQIFGIKYKIKNLPWNKDKNLAGLLGGFVAAVFVGYLSVKILNFENISYSAIILSSIIASLAGTLKRYDNETMPWGTSLTLTLLRKTLGS